MKNIKVVLSILLFSIWISGCNSSLKTEYYHNTLNTKQIWQYSEGESQTIAFIDTGISEEAKSLYSEKIVDYYNSVDESKSVIDEHGHGTQMISVVSGNGEKGITGIAPKSKIIVIKAFDEGEQLNPTYISKAIDYAVLKKADVINMSFGSFILDKKIEESIRVATENNITVVAATGDYGNRDVLFPANLANVVSVRAKTKEGEVWEFSNTSDDDVLAIPGVNIRSLNLNNEVTWSNGTSHATALASGYVALLRDYYIKNKIEFNNDKILQDLRSLNSIERKKVDYSKLFK